MIYVNSAVNPIIYYCRIFSKTAKDYKTSSSGAKVSSGGRGGGAEFSHWVWAMGQVYKLALVND